jgi:protein-disulfide isomerase
VEKSASAASATTAFRRNSAPRPDSVVVRAPCFGAPLVFLLISFFRHHRQFEPVRPVKREFRSTVASVVLVGCAVILTAANLKRTFFPSIARPLATVTDWPAYATGQRIGPANAPVTITVWSDYQCAFCRKLDADLVQVRRELGDKVAIYWRHYPIPAHLYARMDAMAAICAGEQYAFPSLHQALFASGGVPGGRSWASLAAAAGVPDTIAFDRCLRSDLPARIITRDSTAAVKVGAAGTPNVLINSARYQGVPPDLLQVVRHELKRG